MDEQFKGLEEIVHRLIQFLANVGLFNNTPIKRQPRIQNPRNQENKTLKIDIHEFDDFSHEPEHYINWESRMDQCFEFKRQPQIDNIN